MIFTRLSGGQRVWTLLRWAARLLEGGLNSLRGQPPRFWRLSPPVFSRQLIHDRMNRRTFGLDVRDGVDLNLLGLVFDRDAYSLERLFRGADLMALHDRILSEGQVPLIVDCGAHGGFATKFFAETYLRARIVALEPEEENFRLAQSNNAGERISILCAAVGNSDGRGRLTRGHNSLAHRIEDDAGEAAGRETRIVSVNRLIEEERRTGAVPFIIKIVVEGSEEALFEKNTGWIDAFPVLIIELHDWMLPGAANSRNFLREMAKRDRDFIPLGKNIFSISNTLR